MSTRISELLAYFTERSDFDVDYQITDKCGDCQFIKDDHCCYGHLETRLYKKATPFRVVLMTDPFKICHGRDLIYGTAVMVERRIVPVDCSS